MDITRKQFLQGVAGAAASAYLVTPAAAAPKAKIKLSVSIYSYNGDLQLGTMTLEDAIADVADLSAEGIEILGEAHVPNYPNPPDSFVKQWFAWMDKYQVKPSCFDCFVDTRLYKSRALSGQELADQIIRDIKLANKLGYKIYRGLGSSWPAASGPPGTVWANGTNPFDVLEKVLPVAEKYDVAIGEEIHVPALFKSAWFEKTMEFINKHQSKHYGFIPDMSIFERRSLESQVQTLVQQGARPNVAQFIIQSREDGATWEKTQEEVRKMGGNEVELRASSASGVFHGTYSRLAHNDPKDLIAIMPHIVHTHAKFRLVKEDLREATIPYDEIIPVLAQNGFDKYLSSEYEGARGPFEAGAQIRRQHCMMRKLWDAA